MSATIATKRSVAIKQKKQFSYAYCSFISR